MDNNNTNHMTPIERKEALKKGLSVDRLPCSPMISEYVCRVSSLNIKDYLFSAELMAHAHIISYKTLRYDSIGIGPDQYGLLEALGANVHYPLNDRPQIVSPLVEKYSDIKNIKMVNPEKELRLAVYLKALDIIKANIGHEVLAGTGIGGPFSTAGMLRGIDNLLLDLRKNPGLVHKLMEIATANIIKYMESSWKRGYSCSIGDPLASCSVISPAFFREFVKPYLKEIAVWKKQNTGKGLSLHICGNTKPIWHDMAELGAARISLDEKMDLEEAKKDIGHLVGLKGNVPPVDILRNGTPQEVINSARLCLQKAGDNPKGFTLSSGCTIALDTPAENIKAMITAASLI